MKNEVRFRTINVVREEGVEGKVTVASIPAPPVCGENYFDLGFAFCGPKDLGSFNRKYGQMVALGRMKSDRSRVTVKKVFGKTVFEAVKQAVVNYAHDRDIKWTTGFTVENLK
jgi:hypothetical protein